VLFGGEKGLLSNNNWAFLVVVIQNPHSINIITLQILFFGIHKVYKFIGFMLTEKYEKITCF